MTSRRPAYMVARIGFDSFLESLSVSSFCLDAFPLEPSSDDNFHTTERGKIKVAAGTKHGGVASHRPSRDEPPS